MVCKRAALAWTSGSDTQCGEGILRGSSVSSLSSSTSNRSSGFKTIVVPGSGTSEYGWKCGPRRSIEVCKGMLAISEEESEEVVCCVWFHSWWPCKLLHANWV